MIPDEIQRLEDPDDDLADWDEIARRAFGRVPLGQEASPGAPEQQTEESHEVG